MKRIVPTDDEFLNLEHTVDRHEGDLEKLSDRIRTLEADLTLVLRLPGGIANQIIARANQIGNSAYDQEDVRKYVDLARRYNLSLQ